MNRIKEQEAIKVLYGEGCTRKEVLHLQRLRRKYQAQANFLDQNSASFEHLQFLRWLVITQKLTEWPATLRTRPDIP